GSIEKTPCPQASSPSIDERKRGAGLGADELCLRQRRDALRDASQTKSGFPTLLDGFPRTRVQVECLKLLFDEMIALRREFSGTPDVIHFKQPIFHIMVLFVDEAESVARQLKRGRQVIAHNEE